MEKWLSKNKKERERKEALKEREKSLQNENLRFEKATEEEIEELRKEGRL